MEGLYHYLAAGYTCVLLRDGAPIYQSRARGVRPLLDALDADLNTCGCIAVDRLVGRAAAFLYIQMEVAAVTAEVMSRSACELLAAHGIDADAHTLTDVIVNRVGDGLCPMEAATADTDDPEAALIAIRRTVAVLAAK